jgi:hypothetical protein
MVGKMDPYCEINIDKHPKFTTSICIDAGQSPIWHYKNSMIIIDDSVKFINIKIANDDIKAQWKIIGEVNIDINEIEDKK